MWAFTGNGSSALPPTGPSLGKRVSEKFAFKINATAGPRPATGWVWTSVTTTVRYHRYGDRHNRKTDPATTMVSMCTVMKPPLICAFYPPDRGKLRLARPTSSPPTDCVYHTAKCFPYRLVPKKNWSTPIPLTSNSAVRLHYKINRNTEAILAAYWGAQCG